MPTSAPQQAPHRSDSWRAKLPAYGLAAALGLMALAMLVPAVFPYNVRINSFPPIHGEWDPRVGWGTVPALLIALIGGWNMTGWAERLPWGRLLLLTYGVGLAWMLALAYVDGSDGVGEILDDPYEYMNTARARADDFPAMLDEYVERIPYDGQPSNWPVHIAGHPPGAVGFYILLVRLGIDTGYSAGLVTTVLGATTGVAVLLTLRTLGAEQLARRAAPFLALGPAAIWVCVSADGLFAAVGAWGLAALAMAATRRDTWPVVAWSVVAGLLLGYVVMMSYGLPLLGILCLAILWLGGSWKPLPIAAVAALAVVLTFAAYGFNYLEAIPALRDRYFEGVGGRRPTLYWLWGSIAAFLFSAGPLAGAGVAWLGTDRARPRVSAKADAGRRGQRASAEPATGLLARLPRFPAERGPRHAVWVLCAAGVATVLVADASQMSKAEVERIWLPFVPWVLLGCALLPQRWRRNGLWLQIAAALVIQHLIRTTW
jgi:methylthioxylose transferase